jgi:hypothetical protein
MGIATMPRSQSAKADFVLFQRRVSNPSTLPASWSLSKP